MPDMIVKRTRKDINQDIYVGNVRKGEHMIKILYVHGYKGDKYGLSFQRLVKYTDASGVEVSPEFLHKMHKAWFE